MGGPRDKEKKAVYRKAYRERNLERERRNNRQWYYDNIERARETQLMRSYGITGEDYAFMLAWQDNKCAICRTDTPGGNGAFHVDHSHESGEVRGLLCHACNIGIGYLHDDPDLLRDAIEYLEKQNAR